LEWGAKIVAITMGVNGVYLATEDHKPYHIFANQIPVADVPGAGDAFWSEFLTAPLRGASTLEAACLRQTIAEIKIRTVGLLSDIPDMKSLIQRSQQIKYNIFDLSINLERR
jgi:sugar/nucleoside kinase (ribokinase family)